MNINKILSSLSKNLNMIGSKNAALMINNASYLYKYAISTYVLRELSEWLQGDYSKLSFDKFIDVNLLSDKDIARILGGTGIVILSTPEGLMTDREARLRGIGGELLCSVW
jgi:hypothetical protein